ncbi:hypothetical protein C4K38_2955 [Pseudomonas chlororaphis subsp. piscium]|nr:hypothetical protein C4K38_2955 [Pseudomonas chlororaphis subsp. piscium]
MGISCCVKVPTSYTVTAGVFPLAWNGCAKLLQLFAPPATPLFIASLTRKE